LHGFCLLFALSLPSSRVVFGVDMPCRGSPQVLECPKDSPDYPMFRRCSARLGVIPGSLHSMVNRLPGLTYCFWDRRDVADAARRTRSGDFIRWLCSSKLGRGPFQRRSSTVSKTGTSSRRVASVRNNKALLQSLNSDSDNARAFRMDGCHSRQSFGISSRWGY